MLGLHFRVLAFAFVALLPIRAIGQGLTRPDPAITSFGTGSKVTGNAGDITRTPAAQQLDNCASEAWQCRNDRTWFATSYLDRKAVGDFWEVAGDTGDGRLRFSNQYFVGGSVSYVVLHDLSIPIPFTGWTVAPNKVEIEGQVDRHFGVATNTEVVLAVVLRTPDVPLIAGISMNAAVGDGPSYFFSKPAPVEGIYQPKFLNYLSAELEFGSDQVPWLHVVPQLHHRSGAFGLISSDAAGSTYLGIGIRVDLR